MASAPAIVPTCPGMGCPIRAASKAEADAMPAPVPEVLAAWMRPFRGYFTNAVWRHALVLVAGALLAPGRRTVTAALRVMGLEQAPGFAVHHRVLSHARWSSRAVGHRLLLLLVAAFVPRGPWSWASTTRSNGAGGPRSRRAASTVIPCGPVVATSSKPVACAGFASCCWLPFPGPIASGLCRS